MAGHRRQLKRIDERGHARYLTCSCSQRLPLMANPAIRDAFVAQLQTTHEAGGFDLFAYVVMPEHFHLLLLPHDGTVTAILRRLKARFAQRLVERWRQLDAPVLQRITDAQGNARFWQRGGGYDRNIVSDHELKEKIDYIHANPVRRGLVESPCDWVWSTARAYAGCDASGPVVTNPWS